jgi:hypothetical protein
MILNIVSETEINKFYCQQIAQHVSLIYIYRRLCQHVLGYFYSHLQGALTCNALYIFILCILVLFEYGYKKWPKHYGVFSCICE